MMQPDRDLKDSASQSTQAFDGGLSSAIYRGTVYHSRKRPREHRFKYRLFMMYVDLDEVDHLFDRNLFWSTERWNLACFHRANHFGSTQELSLIHISEPTRPY